MRRFTQWLPRIVPLFAIVLLAYADSQYDNELSTDPGRPLGAHRDAGGHDLQRLRLCIARSDYDNDDDLEPITVGGVIQAPNDSADV